MGFYKDVVRAQMDYLFPIGNEKNIFASEHCKYVAHIIENLS